jgi:hypothetical protein
MSKTVWFTDGWSLSARKTPGGVPVEETGRAALCVAERFPVIPHLQQRLHRGLSGPFPQFKASPFVIGNCPQPANPHLAGEVKHTGSM